jgi:hypothetical protein
MFQRNILSPSSALKMEAVCSAKSTLCYNPEDNHSVIVAKGRDCLYGTVATNWSIVLLADDT